MRDRLYAVKDTSGETTLFRGPNCKKIRHGMDYLMKSQGLRIISISIAGTYDAVTRDYRLRR